MTVDSPRGVWPRAIGLAIGERVERLIFSGPDGQRLDRHGAARVVRRVARRARITQPVGPHTLRHAFITAALGGGFRSGTYRKRPRTTMRYDRARASLGRHATYIVAASPPEPRGNTCLLTSRLGLAGPRRPGGGQAAGALAP